MDIDKLDFMRRFIRVTSDGFAKGWHERNGGNLSYRLTEGETKAVLPFTNENGAWETIGVSVPALANEFFLVTGSGKFMRNITLAPAVNIAIIKIDSGGENYKILWGLENGGRPTSELPTHLMNHEIKKQRTGGVHRVIYHAHPANLIAMTFVVPLTDKAFSRELWEMATECPVVFPAGVGVVPWMVPGGRDIALATGKLMETYNAVVWAHHGLFCSGADFDETFGLMETIEKSAEIFVKVLSMGGKKQTIPREGFLALAKEFKVSLAEDFLN
ncbi:MAG: rhamnulose-1-phosphate aldolase [Treponema sp.]|nr:rhamnulose-1-phosphate aldolase [Treponema sp.]